MHFRIRFSLSLLVIVVLLMSSIGCASAEAGCPSVSMPGYHMLWYEGFEGEGQPVGWQTLDLDGDGYSWAFVTTDDILWGSAFDNKQCTGDGIAVSTSFLNETFTPLSPDNWLILPAQEIGTDYKLTFRIQAQDSYYPDIYGVYISTDVANPLNTSSYVQLIGPSATVGFMQTKTLDLSAYEGQQVLIALRHYNCYDQFIIDLDCVTMWAPIEDPVSEAPAPRTGDNSRYPLWFALAAVSLSGIILLTARRKQESR